MVSFGEDIIITIDSVDYTTDIDSVEESGGVREYTTRKMIGNSYKKIETGRSDYELILNFKMEGIVLSELFEITSPVTITVTGADFTITYYNMLASELTISHDVEGFTEGELMYTAPAYDKTNTRYNRVIS